MKSIYYSILLNILILLKWQNLLALMSFWLIPTNDFWPVHSKNTMYNRIAVQVICRIISIVTYHYNEIVTFYYNYIVTCSIMSRSIRWRCWLHSIISWYWWLIFSYQRFWSTALVSTFLTFEQICHFCIS